jgi:hypothetical protein
MPLASEDIVIDLAEAITLVPTLRAAYRLERKYDGFDKLFYRVAGGSVSAIADVIREGAGDCALTRYLDDAPLRIALDRLMPPCLKFILALSGADDTAEKGATGKPIPFAEHHTNLFRIATGWLGWTPEDAWNASPAEILEAYKGRAEMLAAIFGGKNDADKPADISDSDTRRRLNAIGNLANARMP